MHKTREKSTRTAREAKKALVMKTATRRPAPFIIIAAVVAIAAAAGLSLMLFPGKSTHAPVTTASPPPATADALKAGLITHAANLFDDGKARHFDMDDPEGGTTIRYFILKSTDGIIRAAFDACDVCWPEGKGYVQDGTVMICRNCGRRFASVKINEVQGGCNPAPLKRTIEGDQVVIRVDDVMQGRRYFNFSKKV